MQSKFNWSRSTILLLLWLVMMTTVAKAQPNHQHPILKEDHWQTFYMGHGFIPAKLFWEADPDRTDPNKQARSREMCAEKQAQGIIPSLGLMMWSNTYHRCRPGGSLADDSPSFPAYYEWNHARQHYFARKKDGTIWSNNYEDDGSPKDAWITPSRTLDPEDQSPGVSTYGEWYAEKIASFCELTGYRGISMADYADMMPHSTMKNQDFSEDIVNDFERWSGISVPGETSREWADFIKANCFVQWVDYFNDAYSKWWLEMAKRIEQKTGENAYMMWQKHVTPHYVRYGAADPVFMRRHADRAEQVWYHVENWSLPVARGIGKGEISSYVATLGSHLCKEPDIMRGTMLPGSKYPAYVPDAHIMDQYGLIDQFCEQQEISLSAAEKTEMQHKLMQGAWMALLWTHLATKQGEVERAAMYAHTHGKDHYPATLFDSVIQPRYPQKPYGPAFYYSASVEREFEKTRDRWNPIKKIGENARGNSSGNFFPAYYVGDQALAQLKPEAYPTCWISDELDKIPAAEMNQLSAIANIYAIDELDSIPTSETPVRFQGDLTGYAFVDQNDAVILLATRDHAIEMNDITATVHFYNIPVDGEYSAIDLVNGEEYHFSISGGSGSFSFPLERWETRAFETNLPPDLGDDSTDPQIETGKWYRLKNVQYNKYLDTQPNRVLRVEPKGTSNGATWQFEDAGDGYYYIDAKREGRGYLDTSPNQVVSWKDFSTSDGHKWLPIALDDGTFRFRNKKSGREYLVADSDNSVKWNDGEIGSDTQWVLIEVE